jgi:glucosamine kinase
MHNWLGDLPTTSGARTILVMDGGGTRSRALVCSADGELLGYAEGGPTNARSVGDEAALQNIRAVVGAARSEAQEDPDYALLMSAAVDTIAHARFLHHGVAQDMRDAAIAVLPDTTGPWAITNGLGPAVAVIAGTGSVALSASLEPPTFQRRGGWDFVLGDEGSGVAIGCEVVRAALLTGEGRADATDLAEACLGELGVASADEAMDRLHKPVIDKALIGSLALVAFARADAGDLTAERIVREQASLLAATALAACRDLGPDAPPVGLFGGLFESDRYRAEFVRELSAGSDREHEFRRPAGSALAGGLALAGVHCGLSRVAAQQSAHRLSVSLAATV